MDSQHRHELAENELANWLEDFIEKVKPFALLILIGVIGLIAIFVAWGYYQKTSKSNRASNWSVFQMATMEGAPNLSVLENASNELEGAAADWASITWAEGKLYEASENILAARDTSVEAIKQAREKFQHLLLAKGVQQSIRDRAQFGLARSYELEGDIPQAIEEYKKTTGAFAEVAAHRIEDLQRPAAKDDLQWLATAQAPAFTAPFGAPGERPDFAPDDLDLDPASEDAAPESEVTLDDLLQGYNKQDTVQTPGDQTPAEEGAEGEGAAEASPDGPASDGPASDGPTSDGPTSDGPASDGPAAEGSESATEESPEESPAESPEESPAE